MSRPDLATTQDMFTDMLQQAQEPVSAELVGIIRADGVPAAMRLDIYRNNVQQGLIQSLAITYRAVAAVVGEEFFQAMAGEYARTHLPQHPAMMYYGEDFPAFVANYAPAKDLVYLADLARFEWLWSRAYHATEQPAYSPEPLNALKPNELAGVRFVFSASVALMKSDWPVDTIWRRCVRVAAADTELDISGQPVSLMVLRPHDEVIAMRLQETEYRFFQALFDGLCVADALEQAGCTDGGELAGMLLTLFSSDALAGHVV